MAAYVLVGGSWLGGWCWQPVARRLRDNGHDAYPVTLTGLGERVHLASPEVDLETHITDVVNLVEFEDLHDIVLLGHSYGGLAVIGVADRIPERIATDATGTAAGAGCCILFICLIIRNTANATIRNCTTVLRNAP